MKQVTAYIRAELASRAVEALEAAQEAHFITLVHARGGRSDGPDDSYSSAVSLGDGFAPLARLKIVCPDPNVSALVDLVRTLASTGRKGDGMIFVSAVEGTVPVSGGLRDSDVILV